MNPIVLGELRPRRRLSLTVSLDIVGEKLPEHKL